jgi:hypothetical protein
MPPSYVMSLFHAYSFRPKNIDHIWFKFCSKILGTLTFRCIFSSVNTQFSFFNISLSLSLFSLPFSSLFSLHNTFSLFNSCVQIQEPVQWWAKCLAVSQVVRIKLYNSGLLIFYKKFFIAIFTHVSPSLFWSSSHLLDIWVHHYIGTFTWCLGPPLHRHSCPTCCLHENQALSLHFYSPHQYLLGYKPITILALKHHVFLDGWSTSSVPF